MYKHPKWPFSKELTDELIKKWTDLHKSIARIRLFLSCENDFLEDRLKQVLIFGPKQDTPKQELLKLQEWIINVWEGGVLHDINRAHQIEGQNFKENDWQFFAENPNDLTNEFISSDSYLDLYPEFRLVTRGNSATESRKAIRTTKAPPVIKGVTGTSITVFVKPKPDYQHWKLLSYWDLLEASYLLCSCDPDYKNKIPPGSGQKLDPELKKDVDNKHTIIHRSYQSGQLKKAEGSPYDKPYINPIEFIKWAMKKGIDVPDELKEIADEKGNSAIDTEKLKTFGNVGDRPTRAKDGIIEYANQRRQEGNPLVAANFEDGNDETIEAISKQHNVLKDTLRNYVQKADLLAPSKPGRKPINKNSGT